MQIERANKMLFDDTDRVRVGAAAPSHLAAGYQ
jgi:hypothetical protein